MLVCYIFHKHSSEKITNLILCFLQVHIHHDFSLFNLVFKIAKHTRKFAHIIIPFKQKKNEIINHETIYYEINAPAHLEKKLVINYSDLKY